eukprot:8017795-Alexandrium_andersonii.AAC.1
MASFLDVWHRATVDRRAAYKNGEGRGRRMNISQYAIPEQVSRGVGPGRGVVSSVTQYVVSGLDVDAPPPPKRARREEPTRPANRRYCNR